MDFLGNILSGQDLVNKDYVDKAIPVVPTKLSGFTNDLGLGNLAYKSSLVASDIPALDWSKITSGKPTTLAGYGITNGARQSAGSDYASIFLDAATGNYGRLVMYSDGHLRLADSSWSHEWFVLDSNNYSNYAIPLSGGTVGKSTTALAAFNVSTANSAGYPAIGFYNGDTRIGLIRITGDRQLAIYDSAFNLAATVLTSINYSSYALPLTGGTIDGHLIIGVDGSTTAQHLLRMYRMNGTTRNRLLAGILDDNSIELSYYSPTSGGYGRLVLGASTYKVGNSTLYDILHSGNVGSYAVLAGKWYDNGVEPARNSTGLLNGVGAYMNVGYNSDFWFRLYVDGSGLKFSSKRSDSELTGKTIAFTDSNVASATKLEDDTAFTIWGNTFFQSGKPKNVSGNMFLNNATYIRSYLADKETTASLFGMNASNELLIGYGTKTLGATGIYGKEIYFAPNGESVKMRINESGNVGIGTSTPEYKLDVNGDVRINGNLIVTGDSSSGSDIRFKDVIEEKTIKIDDIANAPLFTFKWNDRDDDSIHLGTSAQYWETVTPWLVKGEDFKTLDYATLGVAIGISLANKTMNLEDRVKILEDENKALKAEINRLRRHDNRQ